MYIIIGGDGKQYGPVSGEDLRKWIAEGRVNEQSHAKAESDADWRPLAAFPEFADLFAAQAPASGGPQPERTDELLAGDYELDIGGCFSSSWELVKTNFWPVVGVNALVFILIIAFNQLTGLVTRPAIDAMVRQHRVSPGAIALIVLVSVVAAPVYMILMAGLMKYFLKLIRGEPAAVGDAFAGFGPMIGQLFLLGLVSNLLVLIGYALCIIPGLFLQVAWLFALPLVVDRRLNFWGAMELSRKMVCKHWFMVFAFLIVYTLVVLLGLLACCIGIFVSTPVGLGAWMYAYETIFSRPQTV
jgi:GYF domain 2